MLTLERIFQIRSCILHPYSVRRCRDANHGQDGYPLLFSLSRVIDVVGKQRINLLTSVLQEARVQFAMPIYPIQILKNGEPEAHLLLSTKNS
jgi:hypothetical protein